jgi:hypothetical protein
VIAPLKPSDRPSDPRGGLDFLGPEMLTWLWWRSAEAPRFAHPDGTEVFVHLDEHLELRGERAAARRTVLRSGVPGGSAESRAALRSGKLLVSARWVLARGEEERRLTIKAEDLDFSGVRLPAPEAGPARERLEASLEALERLEADVDLLLATFLTVRTSAEWPAEVEKIRAWAARPSADEEPAPRASAAEATT